MATIGSLVINLLGNHKGLTSALADAKGQLDAFATAGAVALTGIAAAGAGWAVKLAADNEQLAISYRTLLGDAGAAQAMLEDMQAFALRTPFEFVDVAQAGKRMLAMGFNAQQIIPMLENVGDAIAALGGGKEQLDRVILALSQMQAKGKVSAQEMNQLAEQGIAGWEILANSMGKSVAEVMKLAENGVISSTQAIPAIMAGMKEKYGGAMADQTNTIKAQFLNLKETVTAMLTKTGTFFIPLISATIKWTKALVPFIAAMGAFLLVQIAITAATRAYVAAQAFALALSGPAGWAKLAAGAAVGAATLIGVTAAMNSVNTAAAGAATQISKFNTATQLMSGPSRSQIDAEWKATAEAIKESERLARRKAGEKREETAGNDLSSALRDADDELAKLQGHITEVDIKLRNMAEKGVKSPQLEIYKEALTKLEEQKALVKAQEDAEKRVNEQRERGLRLAEKYMSPAEKALKDLQELQELLASGAIDQTTFNRAKGDIKSPDRSQGTAALAADTKEAFSSFLAYQRGTATNSALDEAKKQTKAVEKGNEYLASIDRHFREPEPQVQL